MISCWLLQKEAVWRRLDVTPAPHPLAILLPLLIVCLGDHVGQADKKEVYFYLEYIIDC